jgi:integrase
MPRPINRLSARAVAAAAKPGYLADGGGLYLQVSKSGTKSWVFRYARHRRTHEMGLGSAAVVGLQQARVAAFELRQLLAAGNDPMTVRRSIRATAAGKSWGEAVDAYIDAHGDSWKNEKQAAQWEQSLRDWGPDRSMPVADVDTDAVMACLAKVWKTKTETATRVRGRIERVLDYARVRGWREDGDNPARWRGHLDKLLPAAPKVRRVKHFPSMPYAELPAFMAEVIKRDSLSARALAFTVLTAARTNETVGASWGEFSGDLWTIPGERMKAGAEHLVPLSRQALWVLSSRPRSAPPFPLSTDGMLAFLKRVMGQSAYTVHGFRSSFDTWATETTDFPDHVVDMALAHTISDQTKAAYRRGALLEKRRALMAAWADYLLPDWAP